MVNPKLRDDLNDQLCEAVLKLETVEECYQFFEDICTISEIKAMSQRLEVARMLQDHHTYDDIVSRTGASTATISRRRSTLKNRSTGRRFLRFCLFAIFYLPAGPHFLYRGDLQLCHIRTISQAPKLWYTSRIGV